MKTSDTRKYIYMWIIKGECYMAEGSLSLSIFIPLESGVSRWIPYRPQTELTTKINFREG
jgi:hypothetical protein